MNRNNVSDFSQCLRHAAERVRIANAEGNPILSAWLPEADALLALSEASQHVLVVQFTSKWAEGEVMSDAKLDLETGSVFDILPSEDGEGYETLVKETIAIGGLEVEVSRLDSGDYFVKAEDLCKLKDHPTTVAHEPGTGVEVELLGKSVFGIVTATTKFNSVVSVEVNGTVRSVHKMQIPRVVTSRRLAEQFPVKGSMPRPVVHLLYQLRELEVERLSQQHAISIADLQGLDRLARAMVAATLFEKCDPDTRHALMHDEHPHVRSCAVISQSTFPSAS